MHAILRGWLLLGLAGPGGPAAATHQAPPTPQPVLTLAIIPTSYAKGAGAARLDFAQRGRFHVLLTNSSSQPVVLFEEWNSWGYYGLRFDVTYATGRRVRVLKKPRGWYANIPSTLTLPPHGSYVFDVEMGPEWENSFRPAPRAWQGVACRLRAVYTSEPNPEATAGHVWTGTVVSVEAAYQVGP